MTIDEYVRKEIFTLTPYKMEHEIPQRSKADITRLDLNENFVIEMDFVKRLLLEAIHSIDIRSYPSPFSVPTVQALADFLGRTRSEIYVGNGADGVLASLVRVFVKKQAKVLIVEPTFPMYAFLTHLYGGRTVTAPLQHDFTLDVDAVLAKADRQTSMLLLCSPNNPTANQFRLDPIKQLLREFDGVVAIDETYVDFAKYSTIKWTKTFNNLVVIRSFSKALGLAGIRFGFAVADQSIIQYLNRATSPFELSTLTQHMVTLTLRNWEYFERQIKRVRKEREWLNNALTEIEGIFPFPSDANFIPFKITKDHLSSAGVKQKLKFQKILVKDLGNRPFLTNCIRVTVGSHSMNERFLWALEEIMEKG